MNENYADKKSIQLTRKNSNNEIFNFNYDNGFPKTRFDFLKPNIPVEKMKNRKIVSGKEDDCLCSNLIKTNRYSALNFLPKNLMEQFSKKANIYFLFIGLMQIIPVVSITNGIPYTYLPLSIILLISMLKDFVEDFKRRKSDTEENRRKIRIFNENKESDAEWKDLRVGKIIKIYQDEYIPADLLILNTSEKNGLCYCETKNLDGETNLKIKSAAKELNSYFSGDICDRKIIFNYERPNPLLYSFTGSVTFGNNTTISINANHFLLRGCSLKNTKYIIGLVAYTGHETKIMLNSFKSKCKKSKLESVMGTQIVIIFTVQSLLCLFCSLFYLSFYESEKDSLDYLSIDENDIKDNSAAYNVFVRYGNWTLIFANFVPISLIVSLEMVKLIQGIFITKDSEIIQKTLNIPTDVQSSNLNEELGQIEYIFSDKTGTLTCNIMDFKKVCINGISYGEVDDTSSFYIKNLQSYPKVTNVDFRDLSLFQALKTPSNDQHEKIKRALFLLATCHTVIVEAKEDEICYNASSPDELALINFARFCGVTYSGIDENNDLIVDFTGRLLKCKLLHVFEFNSTRKRQSVIIKTEEDEIFLFCKGADSIIEKRLSKFDDASIKKKTWDYLEEYGRIGLRTLILAERKIENDLFEKWNSKYNVALNTIENRETLLEDLQDEIEKELLLIGATAIEDKLQDDVEGTIRSLRDVGIKIWVLTGDKTETAINIGFSCGLLEREMNRFIVEEETEANCIQKFSAIIKEIDEQTSNSFSLIIHGDSLRYMHKKDFAEKLMEICYYCDVVICCRVSPKQKQQVVTLVREYNPKESTLAIGDGANDVNMITAAHVGIGIKGVEGQQAARASDYSIAEFRFLKRLLLFHGRECYRRNSYLVCFNFFKNICLVLPQFWYGFLNNFSGQTLYDGSIYQLFNLFYTSCPILLYAIFDKEYEPEVLVENKLNYYEQGMHSRLFNSKVFWSWFFLGTWQSIILAYIPYISLESNFCHISGYNVDLWISGTMVFGICVLITNVKVLAFSNTYRVLNMVVMIATLLLYLFSLIIIAEINSSEIYVSGKFLLTIPNLHLGNLLAICCTALIDFAHEYYLKFITREEMGDRKTVLRKSIAYTTAKLNSSSPKNEENNESSLISPQPSVSRPFIDPVIVGNMANMAQFGITETKKISHRISKILKDDFFGFDEEMKKNVRNSIVGGVRKSLRVLKAAVHYGFAFSQASGDVGVDVDIAD